jgi:hypothetical protein
MPTAGDSPQNESCRFEWCMGGAWCEQGYHQGVLSTHPKMYMTLTACVDQQPNEPEHDTPHVSIETPDFWYLRSVEEVETEIDDAIAALNEMRAAARAWLEALPADVAS